MKTVHHVSETETVVLSDDCATLLRKHKVTGRTPEGKEWSRWRLQSQVSYTWRSGRLRLFAKDRIRAGGGLLPMDMTAISLGHGLDWYVMAEFVANRIGVELGEPTVRWSQPDNPYQTVDYKDERQLRKALRIHAYPLLELKPNWTPTWGISELLRASTLEQGVSDYFGKSRYRKDLVRAIGSATELEHVAELRQYRGLVPVDWIVDGLKMGQENRMYIHRQLNIRQLKSLREIAGQVDVNSRKRLIQTSARHSFTESLRMYEKVAASGPVELPTRKQDWDTLHEFLRKAEREIVEPEVLIPQSKQAKELDGLEAGKFVIQSAKTTRDLTSWGDEMHNCIGGYSKVAVAKASHLFGVYQGDQLVANMEVVGTGVRQLFGRFNQRLETEDEKTILSALRALNYQREANGWW